MAEIYFDLRHGCSGDMLVGSLLDCGVDGGWFKEEIQKLNLEGLHITIKRISKIGYSLIDYRVNLEFNEKETYYNLNKIKSIIQSTTLADRVKELSIKAFTILAEAGAQAHNLGVNDFMFHEPRALDSFADVVGFALCVDYLDIIAFKRSPFYDGTGQMEIKDRPIPIPVPAVRKISETYKYPINIRPVLGELITPTGMSLMAAVKAEEARLTGFTTKMGIGNGKRAYNPNGMIKAFYYE